jgi:hypothetical protein
VFDVANDPYELKNLVGDKALLKKLRTTFDAESKAVKFQMPEIPTEKQRPAGNKQRKKQNAKAA